MFVLFGLFVWIVCDQGGHITIGVSTVTGNPNHNYVFGVRKDLFTREKGVLLSGEVGK